MASQVPSSKSASKSELARRKFELMAAEYLQRMGERIAQRREELGLKQEDVARSLPGRTSGSHVSRWERGLHRPSDDTLEALAMILQVDVAYFLAAAPDKSNGTPQLFAGQPVDPTEQLNRIEQALTDRTDHDEKIAALIEKQSQLLDRQTDILTRIETLVLALPTDEKTEELLRAARGEDQPDPQSKHVPGQSERGSGARRLGEG